MGEIVPLRAVSRRRTPIQPPQGPAKILFFLGVRYGRDQEGRPGLRPGVSRPNRNTSGDIRA
jgi:hypothetical protein